MPRTKIIITNIKFFKTFKQSTKFYKTITPDTRIRGFTRTILLRNIIKNLPVVLTAHINHMILNTSFCTNFSASINIFFFVRTVTRIMKRFFRLNKRNMSIPQRHSHSNHIATSFFQQKSRQRRIYTTRKPHYNSRTRFRQIQRHIFHKISLKKVTHIIINIRVFPPAAVATFQIPLSLQPLPSLRSVQWPASPSSTSLTHFFQLKKQTTNIYTLLLPSISIGNKNRDRPHCFIQSPTSTTFCNKHFTRQ